MRAPLPLLCAVVLGCACATVQQERSWTPLEREGEVFLQVLPFPSEARRLRLEVAEVAAVRVEGTLVPLDLTQTMLDARTTASRTVFAQGRLEPGSYAGFSITVRRAALDQGEGKADLLLPETPSRIVAPFSVAARQATLISVELAAESLTTGFSFAPVFTARVEPRPVPQLMGLCTNHARHSLTVFDKRTMAVSAVWPTDAGPWGVALDERSRRAFVSLPPRNEIQVLDLVTGTELARLRLSSGDEPRELTLSHDGLSLLVLNHGSNTLSFIDKETLLETGRVFVGEAPSSLVMDRTGARAYVFAANNQIAVVDLRTRTVETTITTEDRPLRGQLDRAGRRLFVASTWSPNLTVYSVPGFAVERRVHVGMGTTFLYADARTDLLYVANGDDGRISIYDPFSLVPIDALKVAGAVTWIATADAENTLYALQPDRRRVSAFDLTTRHLLNELPVEQGARMLTVAGERR